MERSIRYNLIMNVGGSLDHFHHNVESSLVSNLIVKLIKLPSVQKCLLEVIRDYVENESAYIQMNSLYLNWIYQQVIMFSPPIKTFEK